MGALVQPAYRHDLVAIVCGECGIEFAVPRWWEQARREDHRGFSCPNGHGRIFSGETAEQQRIRELQAQVEREQRERSWAETRARSADIRRGKAEAKLKRLERRTGAGVCPHCTRTFKQLAAHMKSKHPEAAS